MTSTLNLCFFIRCTGEVRNQCWAYVNAPAQCQDLSHRKWDKRKEKPKLSFCIVSNFSEMIRSATPFPLVSLFFMFIGFVLSNIGHVRPHRTILAFVSGIFFILSGTPIVLLISCLLMFCFCLFVFLFLSNPDLFFLCVSGLALVVGLVLYISSINDEMLNRTKSSEAYFTYKYGWSFAFAAISFLLTEVSNRPFTQIQQLWPLSTYCKQTIRAATIR